MTRPKASPIINTPKIKLPKSIVDLHSTLNISADYFFIQYISFLHSKSRGYQFRTINYISSKKTSKLEIEDGLKKLIDLYHTRGISVNTINTDNEFECVRNNIIPVALNVVFIGEHVREVEHTHYKRRN